MTELVFRLKMKHWSCAEKSPYYGQVKALCEGPAAMSMFGRNNIKTQCFVPRKATKGAEMYALNIALKVNLKLGGANFALSHMEPDEDAPNGLPRLGTIGLPYMFIGADVTHPTGAGYGGVDVDDQRSIASVVASVDRVRLVTIVIGGRHFWLVVLAGGPPYIVP